MGETLAEKLLPAWSSRKKVIKLGDLGSARADGHGVWHPCPCGVSGHYALRPWVEKGPSRVPSEILTCFFSMRQWYVICPDVAEVIRGEEESYLTLLRRAPEIVRKVVARRGTSPETFAYLHDTHGIDPDTSRAVLGDGQ